jgi:hypothetical protein
MDAWARREACHRAGHFGPDPMAPLSTLPRAIRATCHALFFLFQERNDDGDSLLRLFLHDPVARIADDRATNV